MLDGKVELLHIAGPETRENSQYSARWILRRGEVDGRLGRKTITGTQPYVDVTRTDGVDSAEGDAARQPEGSVQRAGRIVKDAVSAADDRLGQRLVSEAKTWRDVAVVGLDSGVAVHAVAPCDCHRGRIGI